MPERIVVTIDRDLEDLIPGYLDNRRKDIERILDALGQKDFETIRILGHSMKGSGGGYGFDAVTEFGRSLEAAGKTGDEAGIRRTLDDLGAYLAGVEVTYA